MSPPDLVVGMTAGQYRAAGGFVEERVPDCAELVAEVGSTDVDDETRSVVRVTVHLHWSWITATIGIKP